MAYLSEDVNDLSSRVSEEMISRSTKIRYSFIQNIKTIKKILVSKGVNVSDVQKEAVNMSKEIKVQAIRLKDPSVDHAKILKALLNEINMASNRMISKLNIDPNDKVSKILSLSLFGSTAFIYLIKNTEKMTILPVNLASIMFGPIIEEVGVVLYKREGIKLYNTNVFKANRLVTRWLISSIHQGRFIVPMSIMSMPIITLFRTYEEVLNNSKIQKFIKINDEESLKQINVLFICILLGTYIDSILPFIVKSVRLLQGLSEGH